MPKNQHPCFFSAPGMADVKIKSLRAALIYVIMKSN
jgi:hypothetical protein